MGLLIFTHQLRRWKKGIKLCANLNMTFCINLQKWVLKGVPNWKFPPPSLQLIVMYFVWQRLKKDFSRTVSSPTCFTMFSFVSWMTLAAFSCLFSPARNIHAGGLSLISKTERWTFCFPFCHRSLFRVNKAFFLVFSIQTLNVRFQKGNLTLPSHSWQHSEHAIQAGKKPFGSQVIAKRELQNDEDS